MVDKLSSDTLVNLLKCPKCHCPDFVNTIDQLTCKNCSATYPMIQGVPVFIDDPNQVKIIPPDHVSNAIPEETVRWLKNLDGYSLNIGAGASQTKIPTCIELEYSIFHTTDVVADSHYLPFKDNSFEAVVSFNVFEHLYEPNRAAKEIFRVLKPGGKLIMRTAFLQPLHEEPYHFYNATKYGVMNWFSGFEIENCHVSANFNPVFTLAWLSCDLLYYIEQVYGTETKNKVAQSTLSEWRELWANPTQRKGFLWETMYGLPQPVQERFAAGFELEAVKPNGFDDRTNTDLNDLDRPAQAASISTYALQERINSLETQVRAMETSKFWKLRQKWLRIKRKLGL
ncbi:MAG: methyltransferase domain-containing protein [Plectolyngbya sp. WJT66-NPBG17]|nr:methyltransferase domain-containing protein [Plectolyngbya sp. WJT66-NPBG17]